MNPLSFVIVGSGWRAMFYVRLAQRFPKLFHLQYVLCRTQEKARKLQQEGIPAVASPDKCRAANPDFVVVAVSKSSISQVAEEWAMMGFPVLCETPAGMSIAELKRLWELQQRQGARIQVAEQYCRYPAIKAGLNAVQEGLLGEPYAVSLSVAHDYHAVSLIRHMLGTGIESVKLIGKKYCFPVTETDSRYGPVTDGSVKDRERTRVEMGFASGKYAFYDFSGVQYHSFIRARHLNVQGRDGEWNDTYLRYVDGEHQSVERCLLSYLDPAYAVLETEKLREESRTWTPALTLSEEQDEYAIATMLFDMGEYIRTGQEVYPLSHALEDAYVWLLMQEAVRRPGEIIESQAMPWQRS